MLKKSLLLTLAVCLWLTACQPQPTPSTVTSTPAATAVPAPDASLAQPVVGFVTVRSFENMQALQLRSQPDSNSVLLGQVLPGEQGKLLGLNAEQTWALVEFKTQSGWAPIQALDLTLAE